MAKSDRSGDTQFGVLPYRISKTGGVEVMLLTSRGTGRWVIPKGWPMSGRKPRDVAEIEANQEAGIRGVLRKSPLGYYNYAKKMPDGESRLCEVIVFLMLVTKVKSAWREQEERQRMWFRYDVAASRVDEGSLALMILDLGE